MNSAPFRIVVLASGRGSNFEALADFVGQNPRQAEIVGLVTDKSKAKALKIAEEMDIPSEVIKRQKSERSNQEFFHEITTAVEKLRPDLVVLAGFMRIISANFIKQFQNKIINIHPSLLPSFKGLDAQKQALEAGVHFAGCTVHTVVEEVDAGSILGQAVVPVLPSDTVESLSDRILREEHILLPKVVESILNKEIKIDSQGKVSFGSCRPTNSKSTLSSVN